jgi:hypothetical protein
MRAYNLFRRKDAADLFCAVPEDVPVPDFVTPEAWEYACSLDMRPCQGSMPRRRKPPREPTGSTCSTRQPDRVDEEREASPARLFQVAFRPRCNW